MLFYLFIIFINLYFSKKPYTVIKYLKSLKDISQHSGQAAKRLTKNTITYVHLHTKRDTLTSQPQNP